MNPETNTARNFALQLGSLIALYIVLSALIAVIFGVINVVFPDEAAYAWQYDDAQQGIRFGIAMLAVFFPAYVVLTRLVNQIRRKETGTYLTLTKWLVYLSLLVGGLILLGDLVAVILTFLNGEITTRFVLKAGALLVIIGTAFTYYILDARGYWNTHERHSSIYAAIASSAVVSIIVMGFAHSQTPQEVRQMRLDEQQTMDLSDMQWRIEEHYRLNSSLPQDIQTLYIGTPVPEAPEGRDAYAYNIIDQDTYELCATFAMSSNPTGRSTVREISIEKSLVNPYPNWDHAAGRTCFERTVTPVE